MASSTFCGKTINAGNIDPLPIRGEGFALLSCGGTQIRLSYTALHLIHGWLAVGKHDYPFIRDANAIQDAFASITAEAAEGNQP